MMFPKPERKIKEKKAYNSLQQRKSKPAKEIAPWRKDIVSHHESKPSTKDRGDFPRDVIEELIKEAGGLCQCCKSSPDTTTHHVMPRAAGRGGRGVKTNGLRLCWPCHDRIQTDESELQYWISIFMSKYGEYFWFDEQDWEEHNRKQASERALEEEQRERMERINPIVELLSAAAGRSLKSKEIRLLDGLDDREIATFARLMGDVVNAGIIEKPLNEKGYGYFND